MYNFKKFKNDLGYSEFKHKWFRKGLKYCYLINDFYIILFI